MASSNNMLYQDGYFPPPPPSPAQVQDTRRRSTDRYRPRNYSSPPPQQRDPNLLGPCQQPLQGPQPYQIPLPMSKPASPYQQPPYPTGEQVLVPRVDMPIVAQRQLADELPPRPPVMYPDGLRRASYDADVQMRRSSYDSRRSHHSHHSHHSHRPRYEDEDVDDEYDSERERRHHHHHHHHHPHDKEERDEMEAYRQKKQNRGDNVSRSFGDSLVSVFGQPIKWLIEPRDKY